jgi:hypothetical protein
MKMAREYVERVASEVSKRDGVITNQDVWDAHRYLKVPQDQVRVCCPAAPLRRALD